jgi:hypothetical protein
MLCCLPLQAQQQNLEKVMRAEECSFVRTLQQSRPLLDARPGGALTAVQAMAVQVSLSAGPVSASSWHVV